VQQVGRISGKEIDGLADTIALLNKFDKDGLKVMNKEIYQVVKKIQLEARALMPKAAPLSKWGLAPGDDYKKDSNKNWDQRRLQYQPRAATMGIKSKLESQRVKGVWSSKAYVIKQENAAAMIYETAGRARGQHSKQGEHFIKIIEQRSQPKKIVVSGAQTRVVWKAVNDNRKEAVRDIEAAMARAVNAFNRKAVK
jgi:hypothetical protein